MNFFTSIAKKSTLILTAALYLASASTALACKTTDPVQAGKVVYQPIKVSLTDKSVILDWNTVSESGNSHFEVERSFNNADFKTVALVLDGFSTEGTGKKYAFKENTPVSKNGGHVYYRLKQFDVNGTVSYSEVVKAL